MIDSDSEATQCLTFRGLGSVFTRAPTIAANRVDIYE